MQVVAPYTNVNQSVFSVQRALELLGLIDGDNSDLDVSDNDDPILDGNYQPSPPWQFLSFIDFQYIAKECHVFLPFAVWCENRELLG
ncbi:hypothetical protein R3I94_000446 [Phoxinus phoxinus]